MNILCQRVLVFPRLVPGFLGSPGVLEVQRVLTGRKSFLKNLHILKLSFSLSKMIDQPTCFHFCPRVFSKIHLSYETDHITLGLEIFFRKPVILYIESAKLRATHALVPYVPHPLRALVPHVPHALGALVPYVLSWVTCVESDVLSFLTCFVHYVLLCLTYLTHSCTTRALYFVFSRVARVSHLKRFFGPHPSLASVVSSLTYSYASHVL